MSGRRLWWGLPVVVALVWATGTYVVAGFPGLPAPPAAVAWLAPAARFARDIAAFLTVGSLLVGAVLDTTRAPRALAWARWWALAWLGAVVLQAALLATDLTGTVLPGPDAWRTLVMDTPIGRVLAAQALTAALLALAAGLPRTRRTALPLLVLAVGAAAAPALISHSSHEQGHVAATVSLVLHMASVALWVGGLCALVSLVLVERNRAASMLPRFSLLALWCVLVVAETGLLNASLRLSSAGDLLGTWYGSLVLAKAALLAALVGYGWRQRSRALVLLPGTAAVPAVARVAGAEAVAMGVAIAAAVALSWIGPSAPASGWGVQPLAVVVLGLGLPLAGAAFWPRAGTRVPRWLAAHPEVAAVVLLVCAAEAGLAGPTTPWWITGPAVAGLLVSGWVLAVTGLARGDRLSLGLAIAGWPIALAVAAVASPAPDVRASILAAATAEVLLVGAVLLHPAGDRRPEPSPPVAAEPEAVDA